MYFWNSYPFIRLSIALIGGIVLRDRHELAYVNESLVVLVILMIISLLVSRFKGFYSLRHINGGLLLVLFLFLGYTITNDKYFDLASNHYSHNPSIIAGFSGVIASPVNERTNHFRYDLQLNLLLTDHHYEKTSGIIHLYVRKDSSNHTVLDYGDEVLVAGRFHEVPVPNNPFEFDYKKYLSRKNIYSHAFVRREAIQVVSKRSPNLILQFANNISKEASYITDKHIPSSRENGIAKALLLGIKDHLDNDVKKAYSAAGAMHVLAVSGLHVGIVYLLLKSLLGGLKTFRAGRFLFACISITAIWFYAAVTGLSPSVLRAATMFSLVALGEVNRTKGNIYNSLGVAAFILLVYDPYLIFSVGFQLSFSAVFGIVYLQPKIYRLIVCPSWILDKAWAITCVSIAAQLATFPLTAYYFHQFPTYFLVSNLIVIPAATVILITGLIMLLIDPVFESAAILLGKCLSYFIGLVNGGIMWVERLPFSLIEWIYLDQFALVLSYAITIALIWGLHKKSFKTLIVSFFLFLILILNDFQANYGQSQKHQLVFYEIKGTTAIDYIKGHEATLFVDHYSKGDLELLAFQIDPNRLASHLDPIHSSIQNFSQSDEFIRGEDFLYGTVGQTKLLIIDSTTFHLDFNTRIKADICLVENAAIKNIDWLNRHFEFNQLIIGSRNTLSYCRAIRRQAANAKMPIHIIPLDGAFIFTPESMRNEIN